MGELRDGNDASRPAKVVERTALAAIQVDSTSKPVRKSKIFTNLSRGEKWQDANLSGVFKALEGSSFHPDTECL